MRIALLSTGHPVWDTYPDGGGIQHQVLGLAREIATRGHEVHVLCRSVEDPAPTDGGVIFHPVSVRLGDEILSVLMFSKKAANEIFHLEPDVVSAFERFSAYFPSHRSYPMTFTAENYDAFRYYQKFAIENHPLNAFIHPWKRRLEEGVMRRSTTVIALTESTKGYLESVGLRNLEVIPNGVVSADYANAGDGGYILYAGRLDPPKRVDLLIRAFANLKHLQKDYALRIIGRGSQRSALEELAQDCGIASFVRFEDWAPRERLAAALGNCTVFVLPSAFETFGITLVQAMACSKPVIGSHSPGPKDIISNGKDGILFRNGSVGDLTRALETCLQDEGLRKSLGRQARRTVEISYDFSSVSEKCLQAYTAAAEDS